MKKKLLSVSLCVLILCLFSFTQSLDELFEKYRLNDHDIVVHTPGSEFFHVFKSCLEDQGKYTYMTVKYAVEKMGLKPCSECLKQIDSAEKRLKIVTENAKRQVVRGTPSPSPSSGGWMLLKSWTGQSQKNTESFSVSSNEWQIRWKTTGDTNFIISVYTESGDLKELAVNIIGSSEDSTIIRGAGKYYLNINTSQKYEIAVFQK